MNNNVDDGGFHSCYDIRTARVLQQATEQSTIYTCCLEPDRLIDLSIVYSFGGVCDGSIGIRKQVVCLLFSYHLHILLTSISLLRNVRC